MLETLLGGYQADRAFVTIAFKALLDSPLRSFSEMGAVKDRFVQRVDGYLQEAVRRKELPEQPFQRFLANALWDYSNLIVLYWLRDTSKGASNTTRLVDMSLDILVDVLKSGIVTKAADMLIFLLKSHVYGNVDKLFSVVGLLAQSRNRDTQPGK